MKSNSGMSYQEASKVLGLKPGETVASYRRAFEEVRKHMQRLRDEATTEESRQTYERELARFEEALEVASKNRPKKSRAGLWIFLLFLLAALGGGAYFYGPQLLDRQAAKREAEARLPEADAAVEARNWREAEEIYHEILAVSPRSSEAQEGLQRVREGRDIERKQQVGFLLGRSQALMELRRWDEAEKAMAEALAMEPDDPQLIALAERMEEGRRRGRIERLVEDADEASREEQWQVVVSKVIQLAEADPGNENLPRLQKEKTRAGEVLAQYRTQAEILYREARSLDDGEYSESGLRFLREAQRLSPSKEAADLYRKMSSYVQTVAVPGDAPTIAEGLARVRSGDKILLAEGAYEERLLIPAGVTIESAAEGEAKLVTQAEEGSVIVVAGEGSPVRLVGLTMTHNGISNAEERFPVVLVKGGSFIMENCEVSYGSGHGIAVTEGGQCELIGSVVKGCSWDGIAVTGKGSKLVCRESHSVSNLQHGLDVWDGGIAEVARSRFQDNGLTGILLASAAGECRVENSGIERNREVGVVISGGAHAVLEGNRIAENLLGGVFVKGKGTRLTLVSNEIVKNQKAGLVVASEASLQKDKDNEVRDNDGKQKWLQADFSELSEPPILRALPAE
jgi:tetratricopeptide (TPR) repeat protein